jgi:hypothetical protein
MLAKQELFRLPIFSAAMRGLRCIPIDRDNVRQSFPSGKRPGQIRHNSIVVFPEGPAASTARCKGKTGPFYLAEMARADHRSASVERRARCRKTPARQAACVEVRTAIQSPRATGTAEAIARHGAVRVEELCRRHATRRPRGESMEGLGVCSSALRFEIEGAATADPIPRLLGGNLSVLAPRSRSYRAPQRDLRSVESPSALTCRPLTTNLSV